MKRLTRAELKSFQQDQLNFMQQITADQGPVVTFKILWLTFCLLSDPATIRELLVKNGDKLKRDPFVANVFGRVMGNGVFVAEGDFWKKQRKLMQPAFHASRIRAYTDTMAQYTRDMLAGWQTGQTFAIDEVLTELTLRIIAKTMYGVDLESQTAVIGHHMKELLTIVEEQVHASYVPPAWVPTASNRRHRRTLQAIRQILHQIIQERRAQSEPGDDLLSMLLEVRDEDGQPMSDQQLLDECITLFIAGHETTAATLTWVWHNLTQHPDSYHRLTTEIKDVLQGRPITFDQLPQLPYLDAVIKETLRMYTPAPSFGRATTAPITIGDHHFPKKTIIFVGIHTMHHRPELYPDPNSFRPERFLDPDTHPDRYTYMPFGAGARICLGNMFSMLETAVILATMLQQVDLERNDTNPVTIGTRVTVRPRDPLIMRVKQHPPAP